MINKSEFLEEAAKVINWMDHYLQNIDSFPVRSKLEPHQIINKLPKEAPEIAESIDSILNDMDDIIMKGVTHWQHPNYHAYFTANSSIESIFGDMLSATIGAQCMNWISSPSAAELEERMMEWLQKAMGLPEDFEGVIQDTASSATLVAILTAREVATNFTSNYEGVPNNLRVYCSTETHSSIEKAVRIAGIGSKNLVKIDVDNKQAMIAERLEAAIQADIEKANIPCCVIVTIGTTGTLGIDPLNEIADICKNYKIWCHVDAAYAGSALLLPEYQWMAKGIEKADSFVFNPHKWMFTNFDCSCYYVKNVDVLLRTLEILPEYLKTKERGVVNDYKDWGIPLGRRFRSLKLWFVIRSFGMSGIREAFRNHIRYNEWMYNKLHDHPAIECITGPFLNFCSFRFHPENLKDNDALNALNTDLLEKINQSGKCYMTHTKLDGQYIIRFVVGQTYVKMSDVEKTWLAIKENADIFLID